MVDLSADLASIAAEALVAVAKRLREGGENDYAGNLIQQAADIELLSSEIQNCWGGPFNGQEGRLAIIQELLEAVVPTAIVETGTYRGISTHWLAQHFTGPIWSCEAENLYFLQAEQRLKGCRSVFLELSDSRAFLKRLVLTLSPDQPTFFYLDAHWNQDLPLRDELATIFASQPKAVVMIDDFRIPQDAGYGWDDYGIGARVDATALAGVIPDGASIYVPTLLSSDETGAKRGCCVIAWDLSGAVDRCRLLERRSLSDLIPSDGDEPTSSDREAAHGIEGNTLVAGLKAEIVKINLGRAQRLQDILLINQMVAASAKEIETLGAERAIHLRDIETLKAEIVRINQDRAQRLQDNLTLNQMVVTSAKEIETLRAEREIRLRDIETLKAEIVALNLDRAERVRDISNSQSNGRHIR